MLYSYFMANHYTTVGSCDMNTKHKYVFLAVFKLFILSFGEMWKSEYERMRDERYIDAMCQSAV